MKAVIVVAATSAVFLAGAATAQEVKEIDKPASKIEQVLAHPVEMGGDGQEVRVVRVTVDPRTAAAWHTHPTPVYVYVMEGGLRMEVEGKEPRDLTQGEAVAEPLDARMRVVNESDQPAEVVVFQISPKQKEFLKEGDKKK